MAEVEFTWALDGYCARYGFLAQPEGLTMREAARVFQLDPQPPEAGTLNDYITAALRERNLDYFSFFLHHYETRLNGRVRRFLMREGLERYDPERFLDYKMGCVLAMLDCLPGYDPMKEADFLTYAHYFIGNALLECRRQEEAGSFQSLDEYKAARGIAWLYNNSGKSTKDVIAEYANHQNCTEMTAAEYLALAQCNRSRVPFYQTVQDEEGEETGEDVSRDDSWNYADILWNSIRAKAVREAFEKLDYREQTLLEKRNAVCMTCGRVSPLSTRMSFEDLAVQFEGSACSNPSGDIRADATVNEPWARINPSSTRRRRVRFSRTLSRNCFISSSRLSLSSLCPRTAVFNRFLSRVNSIRVAFTVTDGIFPPPYACRGRYLSMCSCLIRFSSVSGKIDSRSHPIAKVS